MSTPKKTGRPRNAETDKIAKETGYTKRHAQRLQAEMKATGTQTETMIEAKLRKTIAEADRIEHLLQVQKGKYILKIDVEEEAMAAGAKIKAHMLAWIGSLPGRLEGLSASAMVPILEAEVHKTLKEMANANWSTSTRA